MTKYLHEFIRCTRHNLLHMHIFKLSYSRGLWHVRDGNVEMVFPYYPYLNFHDIEGYLKDETWRPKPGMTVLDVGGCYGEFAIYASKCVGPTGRVLMLEPDPANIAIAEKNICLNGSPKNLTIVPAGLWSEPTKLRFNVGQGPVTAIEGLGDAVTGGKVVEIEVESLPSVAEKLGLDRIDFVKMDIEGAEMQVIDGAAKLPAKFRPRYSIASYHILDGKKTADLLPATFAKIGYDAENGNERHLTTYAWPK